MKRSIVPCLARRSAVVAAALALVVVLALAVTARAAAGAGARATPSQPHAVGDEGRTVRDGVTRGKDLAQPVSLRDAEGSILAFPPRASTAKPLTVVYLHGIHGRAENGCPWLRDGATEIGWLVCPSANAHLANDTYSWAGSVFDQRAVVARAERAAWAHGADPAEANMIVGFSQGAFVALDLVRARLGSYRGLVLIGADVTPAKAMLDGGGVRRIVLAAGSLDASYAPLQRAAERLRREGMVIRFLDLGRIGHTYETTDKEALRDAIAWAGRSS